MLVLVLVLMSETETTMAEEPAPEEYDEEQMDVDDEFKEQIQGYRNDQAATHQAGAAPTLAAAYGPDNRPAVVVTGYAYDEAEYMTNPETAEPVGEYDPTTKTVDTEGYARGDAAKEEEAELSGKHDEAGESATGERKAKSAEDILTEGDEKLKEDAKKEKDRDRTKAARAASASARTGQTAVRPFLRDRLE